MPQVVLQINGRNYTLQCGEGQEEHLRRLARMLDSAIADIREKAGPLGDLRLLIMASLVMADQVVELQQQVSTLSAELERLRQQGDPACREAATRLLQALDSAASRLERLKT